MATLYDTIVLLNGDLDVCVMWVGLYHVGGCVMWMCVSCGCVMLVCVMLVCVM